ncbi:MAG: DUF4382 domain-containing protein [Terriglobia bacterium]
MRASGLRKLAWTVPLFALALASLSCNGGGGGSPPPIGTLTGTGYFFISDAPPAGTSLLRFEITVDSATLCSTVGASGECQGVSQVSLIDAPLDLDLINLQLGSAFVGSKTVPAGSYAGVRLTISDYSLKLMLPDGTVKEYDNTTLPLSSTGIVSASPTFTSPLNVTDSANVGFLLDIDVNNSIQATPTAVTGVAPVVNLFELPITASQPILDMPARKGRVTSLTKTCTSTESSGTFTLTDALTGAALTGIIFDNTTLIGEPTDATDNKDITCATFVDNQVVEVDILAEANADGSVGYFARQIQLVGAASSPRLEGTVFQVNTTSEFVLLVTSADNLSTVPTGSFITVSFDPLTAVFRMDAGFLPALVTDFDTGDDLFAGQTLKVDVTAGSVFVADTGCKTIADLCTAGADSLRLKQSTLSGRVAATADPRFTLDTLPSIFGTNSLLRPLTADCQSCSAGTIEVLTSEVTGFGSPLTNVSSLILNDIAEARGLLVKDAFSGPGPVSGSPPLLLASRVRLQL